MIDLHALRRTLATQLARAGVTPRVAQRIMRHGDCRTTLKHCRVLGLTDTAAAVGRLPKIASPRHADAATGTTDAAREALPRSTQPFCQQLERERGGVAQRRAVNRRSDTIDMEAKRPAITRFDA